MKEDTRRVCWDCKNARYDDRDIGMVLGGCGLVKRKKTEFDPLYGDRHAIEYEDHKILNKDGKCPKFEKKRNVLVRFWKWVLS